MLMNRNFGEAYLILWIDLSSYHKDLLIVDRKLIIAKEIRLL